MAMKSNFMAAVYRTSQDLAKVAAPVAGDAPSPDGSNKSANVTKSADGTIVASSHHVVQSAAGLAAAADKRSRRGTTVYLDEADYMMLKLLAVKERRKLNEYLVEAVEDYMEKIADRLS